MLHACIHFPRLALDALATGPHDERQARAVYAPGRPARIVAANRAALRAGVRPGQPLANARAACGRLNASPRDAEAERTALEAMAALAWQYGPQVSVMLPDVVSVEVGASLRLFGGWTALERRLRAGLDATGFAWQLGAAPTAAAAHVFARQRPGLAIPSPAQAETALARVPLADSSLPDTTVAALRGMGLATLGDLFRLPRAALARRIGPAALAYLDRLRGRVPEVLPRWSPAERHERRIAFEHGIADHAALVFPLRRLLHEFARILVQRDAAVQRFTLALEDERGHATRIPIEFLVPQCDPDALLELARARLERHAPAHPVFALALHADDLPLARPLPRDLFDTRRPGHLDWPALAERLRARLGDSALHGLACVADHRPARASRFVATDTPSPSAPSLPQPRPFWLLPRPLPLAAGAWRVLVGPERIESGWWDGGDQRRDYYVIETHAGQRAWAFVESGRPAYPRGPGWYLHGWFA